MLASTRAWFWGSLAVLLAGCGESQTHASGPDQPPHPDDAPVIVIGRPTTHLEGPKEPLAVAADAPAKTVAATAGPTIATADDLARIVRDPRRITLSPRQMPLLVTEIQGLESLFANTPTQAADRPKLMRRLADTYVELKNSSIQEKQRLQRMSTTPAQEIVKLEKVHSAARTMAVKYYVQLINTYPAFCISVHSMDPGQSRGCRDEAHYFVGLEYLDGDQPDEARRQFMALIKDFPQSKWLPHGYFAFGEMFFREAAFDPGKLDFAQQAYEKVLQFPPPDNATYGFTHYRLGQVHKQKQDASKALVHTVKAAEFSAQYAALPGSELLGEVVRRDIVPVYAHGGAPQKAEAFFQRVANDMPTSNERLVNMLDALVRFYLHDNKRAEAMAVCQSSANGTVVPACGQI